MYKRLFVIGDSISIQYGPMPEKLTDGYFTYDRKGKGKDPADLNYVSATNGGDSGDVLRFVKSAKLTFDILLFNCGLHDIKTADTECQVPADLYRQNLEQILAYTQQPGKHVVWVSSTPVDDARHNRGVNPGFRRYNADLLAYNAIAADVMTRHNVPVIDLYRFTACFAEDIYADHVHFIEKIRHLQAAFIAGQLIGLFGRR